MTDLERTLPAQLSTLADELAHTADLHGQAAAARSRYRHQRRVRAGLAAVAVAVAAIGVGVPTAVGSFSSAPATGGRTADLRTTVPTGPSAPTGAAPAAGTDTRAETAAQSAAAAAAARAAAESSTLAELAAAQAERQGEVAGVAGVVASVDADLRLVAPSTAAPCPSAGPRLGVPLAYRFGSVPGPVGCTWSTSGQGAQEVSVTVTQLPDTTMDRVRAGQSGPGASCAGVDVPASGGLVQRCQGADGADWSLFVPDAGGSGVWQLAATIGTGRTDVPAGQALSAAAELARATWAG